MSGFSCSHELINQLQDCLHSLDQVGLYTAAAHVDHALQILRHTSEMKVIAPVLNIDYSVDFTYFDELAEKMFY